VCDRRRWANVRWVSVTFSGRKRVPCRMTLATGGGGEVVFVCSQNGPVAAAGPGRGVRVLRESASDRPATEVCR